MYNIKKTSQLKDQLNTFIIKASLNWLEKPVSCMLLRNAERM